MKTKLFLFLLFFSVQAFGQDMIGIQWNDTDIGHNMGVFYEAPVGDFTIGVGVTALLDNARTPSGHIYHKRAYAKNPKEKIGLNFSLSYPFYRYSENLQLQGVYRAFYANTRFGREIFNERIISHEHYLGLKVDIPISNRLVLTQSAGGGMAFFKDTHHVFLDSRLGVWELSYFVSVGLGYKLRAD